MPSSTSLIADTYVYFQAIRNLGSPCTYTRAHAKATLRNLSFETKSPVIAEASVNALVRYGDVHGWSSDDMNPNNPKGAA